MNSGLFKKILPHLIAVIVFLVVTLIYFYKPLVDGYVMNQSDIVRWKGIAQNAFEYKAKHGHFPLWNSNLFSGMPNYQVAMEGKSILPDIPKIMSLGLPKPLNFFFLCCICFYILCISFRLKPVIGILGGLAFAFSTYNMVVVGAGHESQILAIAFMPFLLAGMIFTFEKKYWLGLVITILGAYLEIAVNHVQISYYFMLIAVAVTIPYLVTWIRKKDWKHIFITAGIVLGAALIGVAASAVTLLTTYEYAKATMRGGKDISIEGDKVTKAKTSGLDTSYAFQYSYGKAEVVNILMPEAFGGSSNKMLDENSHVVEKLTAKGIPEGTAMQIPPYLSRYWGGIIEYTAGPFYYGVIICLLALIAFIVIKTPLRWGLLAVSVLGIMMAWGKYLPGFNSFLFEHLPFYNKFRAPSMAMVITQFTVPIIAVLGLQQLLYRENSRGLLKADFKKILYTVGGLFVLLLIMYMAMSYSSPIDNEIASGISQQAKSDEIGRAVIAGMKEDRRNLFGAQILRAFGFALLLIGLLFLYIRKLIKPLVVAISLVVITTIDLLVVDKGYLNNENFVSPEELSSENFVPSVIDQQILQDRDPDFRVFNAGVNMLQDARTSYFHKSIGGYHPARLRIYQDIIDKYLSGGGNQNILNMLNTKYIIVTNRQNNQQQLIPNPNAYGPCWLVKNVKIAQDVVEEIQAIGTTNLRDTAIVQKSFESAIIQPQWDSAATVKLIKFDNDTMEYSFNSTKPQFAVFSEVYYPYGWNAYIDGKKTAYCKTDYVLRGLSVPAGQHSIKFVFEPSTFKKGVTIAYVSSFLILILVAGGLFMEWRTSRKNTA